MDSLKVPLTAGRGRWQPCTGRRAGTRMYPARQDILLARERTGRYSTAAMLHREMAEGSRPAVPPNRQLECQIPPCSCLRILNKARVAVEQRCRANEHTHLGTEGRRLHTIGIVDDVGNAGPLAQLGNCGREMHVVVGNMGKSWWVDGVVLPGAVAQGCGAGAVGA